MRGDQLMSIMRSRGTFLSLIDRPKIATEAHSWVSSRGSTASLAHRDRLLARISLGPTRKATRPFISYASPGLIRPSIADLGLGGPYQRRLAQQQLNGAGVPADPGSRPCAALRSGHSLLHCSDSPMATVDQCASGWRAKARLFSQPRIADDP